jgi:alpha-tubulin suppressor-like RCC1 family protein
VSAIAAGGGANTGQPTVTYYGHSCALASGAVFCWGGNESGQLGARGLLSSGTPLQVVSSKLRGAATSLAVGDRHTCVVDSGAGWCWGANFSGQLGNGSTSLPTAPTPDPQRALQSAASVAAGAEHSCGIAASALSCWGDNSSGQVNAGVNSGDEPLPVAVALPGVQPASAAGGGKHTCVVGAAGDVTCFGANDVGQLGGPASARGLFTVGVPATTTVTAGFAHTCALLQDGGIQCWGANDRGQLGTGHAGGPVADPGYVAGG